MLIMPPVCFARINENTQKSWKKFEKIEKLNQKLRERKNIYVSQNL